MHTLNVKNMLISVFKSSQNHLDKKQAIFFLKEAKQPNKRKLII